MTNQDIATHVKTIADALLKDHIVKPADKPVLDATIALVTNLLQNINTIAGSMGRIA